jgi:hypothetical protein
MDNVNDKTPEKVGLHFPYHLHDDISLKQGHAGTKEVCINGVLMTRSHNHNIIKMKRMEEWTEVYTLLKICLKWIFH